MKLYYDSNWYDLVPNKNGIIGGYYTITNKWHFIILTEEYLKFYPLKSLLIFELI